MNNLMLSATAMLFAGQALGHVSNAASPLYGAGARFVGAMAVAGVICLCIGKLKQRRFRK